MINSENVERIANIFTGFFLDLNFNDKLKEVKFLEFVLGYIYSYKKVMDAIGAMEVFTQEQLKNINETLDKLIVSIGSKEILEKLKEKNNGTE